MERLSTAPAWRWSLPWLLLGLRAWSGPGPVGTGPGLDVAGDAQRTHRVERHALVQAMRRESGYDPTTTTNAPRFQGRVLIDLARQAARSRPGGPPLFIHHEDWYRAFLEAAGLEEAQAPLLARLAWEHGQDTLVDYGSDRVLRKVVAGLRPALALNVWFWWPENTKESPSYSFDDTLSVPRLRVTYARVISYRLLDLGHMMVYDDIRGLSGRPTTGLLGLLFRLIGEGHVAFSRIAVAADGTQIVYARARKGPFAVSSTVTVRPNGVAEKGLPPDRPELVRIEGLLKEPLQIEYVPWEEAAPLPRLGQSNTAEELPTQD